MTLRARFPRSLRSLQVGDPEDTHSLYVSCIVHELTHALLALTACRLLNQAVLRVCEMRFARLRLVPAARFIAARHFSQIRNVSNKRSVILWCEGVLPGEAPWIFRVNVHI